MTADERQAFRNHFWTAQLIAGLIMAGKLLFAEGFLAGVAAFFVVMPISACASWIKVKWFPDRPDAPPPSKWPRKGVLVFAAMGVCVTLIAVYFDIWG